MVASAPLAWNQAPGREGPLDCLITKNWPEVGLEKGWSNSPLYPMGVPVFRFYGDLLRTDVPSSQYRGRLRPYAPKGFFPRFLLLNSVSVSDMLYFSGCETVHTSSKMILSAPWRSFPREQ